MASDDLNPRKGKSVINLPFAYLVNRADPDRRKEARKQLEYEFGGERVKKYGDPTKRGAYADS